MRTIPLLQVLLAATLAVALPTCPSSLPFFDCPGDTASGTLSSLDAVDFKALLRTGQACTSLNLAFNRLDAWQLGHYVTFITNVGARHYH